MVRYRYTDTKDRQVLAFKQNTGGNKFSGSVYVFGVMTYNGLDNFCSPIQPFGNNHRFSDT